MVTVFEWSEPLVNRVLEDLTMERIIHGQRKKIVLPSELQIVFQMVQTKRIANAGAYPGKRRLLDYIGKPSTRHRAAIRRR